MNILRHSKYKRLTLVDGYNLLFSDNYFREKLSISLEEARSELEELLIEYGLYINEQIVVIYDGHFVKDNRGDEFMKDGLLIVFTSENETADSRIESLTFKLSERFDLTVVTSDFLEQQVVFMKGIIRFGSREFLARVRDSFRLEEKIHKKKIKLERPPVSDWKDILREYKFDEPTN